MLLKSEPSALPSGFDLPCSPLNPPPRASDTTPYTPDLRVFLSPPCVLIQPFRPSSGPDTAYSEQAESPNRPNSPGVFASMKAADTLALFLDMAVASKVVSKRSARTFVEDGMEKELYEPHARKSTLRFDEVRLEEVEGPSSKSSSKSSSTSQTDVDISTSAAERTETGTAGIDLDIGDGGDQIVASKAPKLAGDSDDAEPEGLSTRPYPPNFGIVVPGVYRSSYPQPQAYGFLQDLGLKTIM